ncbi:hypothetical protein J3E69DRAFT_343577 [Trichoderma sp. SZMC 28015]
MTTLSSPAPMRTIPANYLDYPFLALPFFSSLFGLCLAHGDWATNQIPRRRPFSMLLLFLSACGSDGEHLKVSVPVRRAHVLPRMYLFGLVPCSNCHL